MSMNRYRLVKIIGLAGIPLLIFLWFLVFFMPNMVETNQVKRQLKDIADQLKRNIKVDDQFENPDRQELERFRTAEEELQNELPSVDSADGFLRLITTVSGFLKETAAAERLSNLIVSSNSRDLEINAQTLPQSGESLEELLQFTSNRLREIQVESERNGGNSAVNNRNGPFGLSSHNLYMAFSGDLKPALSFLHRLPMLDRSLRIEKMVVCEGVKQPLFLVYARLFFWDHRGIRRGGTASPEAGNAQK